jgi:hypothetical protein
MTVFRPTINKEYFTDLQGPGTLIDHLKSFRRKHIQTTVVFNGRDIPKCQRNRPLYVIQSAEGRNMTSITPVRANGTQYFVLV